LATDVEGHSEALLLTILAGGGKSTVKDSWFLRAFFIDLKVIRALFGQAPIGLLCLILAYFQLPQVPSKHNEESRLSLWSFDWLGLGAFVISASAFVLGTTAGSPALDGHRRALFTTSAIFLTLLVFIERRASNPIFPGSIVPAQGLRNIFMGQITFFSSISLVRGH
jgi:hypothetical protein